ncbi:hydrogenase small subunit [Hydrogenivirga sp. 128-5-R1-1]|uniref:hydrogenase small subunit n=1 Tax=Hydrogenivirga sp. 128-5-R1-1 TaxID=392423 RepID=UPI00015F3956|nr:hydrogenase small subunit [Hydrogenivirga sp. 128-5-R1-1]EDP75026.1 hydrogenase small subunit [Hydrogenivirga sp. 128-5-R1-1]
MQTLPEVFKAKGYSRRDFLKFATLTTAILGLPPSMLPKVVHALETKPKPVVIWLEFQDCAGCSESFIRSTTIMPTEVLLDFISLEYHETLMAPAGEYAEESKREAMERYKGKYILVVEGSVTPNGVYCTVGGRSSYELLKESAENAAAVMAVGSCACWGGVPKAEPNPTGAVPLYEALRGKTVVNIPGCPPIGDVMVATLVHFLALGKLPPLDSLGRPKTFYGQTIHDRCYRRAFYNAGKFAGSFDDDKARNGYCLYKLGCKGPITRNACATIRWNGGLSFPIQSGHPCFGCAEPDFWDRGFIYQPLSVVEMGFGLKKIATGVAIGAAAGAGIAWMNRKLRGGK